MGIVSVSHVSRRFGARIALDDVTVDFTAGAVVGIVGPNGAGKTTLLRVIAGLIRPTRGVVVRESGLMLRYFGGEQTLPPDAYARNWSRLWSRSLDSPWRRFGVLSRGTRQRIGLEAVLSGRSASLVLLDEPWEGLDPDASRWLSETLDALRRDGSSVVVSSHRIHDLAAVCDRCEFLVNGRLAGGVVECASELTHEERVTRLLTAFDRARA